MIGEGGEFDSGGVPVGMPAIAKGLDRPDDRWLAASALTQLGPYAGGAVPGAKATEIILVEVLNELTFGPAVGLAYAEVSRELSARPS